MDQTLSIAKNSGPALEAVSLEVGRRDVDRAVAIIEMIEPFEEISGGERVRRNGDSALASLAIQVAEHKPELAEALSQKLADYNERARALIGVSRVMARRDGQRALAFFDNFVDRITDTDHGLEGAGADHDYRRNRLPIQLALAFMAAESDDQAVEREVRQRWAEMKPSRADFQFYYFDILARIDLLPIRGRAVAQEIATSSLEALVKRMHFYAPTFRHAYDATGELAAALAVFDVEKGLEFVEWACENMPGRDALFREEVLLKVAKAVGRYDSAAAMRVIDRIMGWHRHLALVAVVKAVSQYDFDRALAIADAVEDRFARTKAELLGILGNQLRAEQLDRISAVLARLPRYVQSDAFREPFFGRVALGIAPQGSHRSVRAQLRHTARQVRVSLCTVTPTHAAKAKVLSSGTR